MRRFFESSTDDDKSAVIEEAEEALDDLEKDEDRSNADIYLKLMRKAMEKGNSFIEEENTRVKKLLEVKDKVNSAKRKTFEARLNILTSMKSQIKHEEL